MVICQHLWFHLKICQIESTLILRKRNSVEEFPVNNTVIYDRICVIQQLPKVIYKNGQIKLNMLK